MPSSHEPEPKPGGTHGSARVTVVVPCHNDGRLLVEALLSIDEPEPVDVVVVDDYSQESETRRILDQLAADGTRVIRHPENKGLAEARNSGLRSAQTPYLFPLDADDLAVPGALAEMANVLAGTPDAAVCFGDYLEFGTHELVRAVPSGLDPYRLAYVNEYPVTSLFRRSALLSVGGWRALGSGYPAGYEDWDLWLTLVERGYSAVHVGAGRLTYRRRYHGERMLTAAKRQHRWLYRRIREDHPAVFNDIARHRRQSDLPRHRKLLYPVVYGARPRFAFEPRLKRMLDRLGIWTMRR